MAWGRLLVAVEVKTLFRADPVDEFTPAKAERFRRAGGCLRPAPGRFDLVAVCVRGDGVGVRWLPGVC